MQQLIPAGLVDAPVAETVRAEDNDVCAVERIKAVDRCPDVLNILFRISLVQRVGKNCDQRLTVDLHAVIQLEGISVLEPKRNVSFELRAAGIAVWDQVLLRAHLQITEAASVKRRHRQLLVDAVADPASFPGSAEPEKTPVDAILVTAENAADYLA